MNLNASSAAPNYVGQYLYIRNPSTKKPLSEIDTQPYHSSDHPMGEVLQQMIQRAERVRGATQARRQRPAGSHAAGGPPAKLPRLTFCDVADVVAANNILSVNAFHVCAKKLRESGDPRLSEYCGRQRSAADALRKIHDYLLAKDGAPAGAGAAWKLITNR